MDVQSIKYSVVDPMVSNGEARHLLHIENEIQALDEADVVVEEPSESCELTFLHLALKIILLLFAYPTFVAKLDASHRRLVEKTHTFIH